MLWFGGMGGRGFEVADQDRQKSPRIPSHQPMPAFSPSYVSYSSVFLHRPPFTPHHKSIFIIILFICSFIFLITFHFVHATCLMLEQLGCVSETMTDGKVISLLENVDTERKLFFEEKDGRLIKITTEKKLDVFKMSLFFLTLSLFFLWLNQIQI